MPGGGPSPGVHIRQGLAPGCEAGDPPARSRRGPAAAGHGPRGLPEGEALPGVRRAGAPAGSGGPLPEALRKVRAVGAQPVPVMVPVGGAGSEPGGGGARAGALRSGCGAACAGQARAAVEGLHRFRDRGGRASAGAGPVRAPPGEDAAPKGLDELRHIRGPAAAPAGAAAGGGRPPAGGHRGGGGRGRPPGPGGSRPRRVPPGVPGPAGGPARGEGGGHGAAGGLGGVRGGRRGRRGPRRAGLRGAGQVPAPREAPPGDPHGGWRPGRHGGVLRLHFPGRGWRTAAPEAPRGRLPMEEAAHRGVREAAGRSGRGGGGGRGAPLRAGPRGGRARAQPSKIKIIVSSGYRINFSSYYSFSKLKS